MFSFSKKGVSWSALVLLAGLAMVTGYWMNSPESGHNEMAVHDHDAMQEAGTEIWSCSMDPQVRSPKPGLCPICGMDLVPLSTLGSGMNSDNPREITLSEKARKSAEVVTAPVERKPAFKEIRLFGKVAYDETALAHITAWVPGRIEKLYVDFTGIAVEKGKPLAEFYSPELLVAQEELLQALRAYETLKENADNETIDTAKETIEAVREKFHLWGISPEQVQAIEKQEAPSDRITLLAPITGTVIEKNAAEGLYVTTGTCLFILSDFTRMWVKLDAYEYDVQWIAKGQEVAFRVEAYPGETYTGHVDFIDPMLDETTRTIKVRLDVENPEVRLKPGMFVRAMIFADVIEENGEDPLLIPASAALITGKRAVVYVAHPERQGVYEGREVILGARVGDQYVVRKGLAEGEEVVVNGNFKIDSALQLSARPSMMEYEGDD
ncbi:MAG: efflux RND transporter periplasmic adaptor subunit [Planctomycetota bacterium]